MSRIVTVLFLIAVAVLWRRWQKDGGSAVEMEKSSGMARQDCTLSTCWDVAQCGRTPGRLTVYVQPLQRVENQTGDVVTVAPSKEFLEMRRILTRSKYAVETPEQACVILLGVDTLNENRYSGGAQHMWRVYKSARKSLPNVIMFNVVGRGFPADDVIMIRSESPRWLVRDEFDVAGPFLGENRERGEKRREERKTTLLVPMQHMPALEKMELREYLDEMEGVRFMDVCEGGEGLCDDRGERVDEEKEMRASSWVLIHESLPAWQRLLQRTMRAGALPILFTPNHVLPFEGEVEWESFSIRVLDVSRVSGVLARQTKERVERMRTRMEMVYKDYFSTLERSVLAAMSILEKRVLPIKAASGTEKQGSQQHVPRISPSDRWTAVCLMAGAEEEQWARGLGAEKSKEEKVHKAIAVYTGMDVQGVSTWPSTVFPIRVVAGVTSLSRLGNVVGLEVDTEAVVLFSFPSHDEGVRRKMEDVIAVWRSNPDVVYHILAGECVEVFVMHKSVLQSLLMSAGEMSLSRESLVSAVHAAKNGRHLQLQIGNERSKDCGERSRLWKLRV